MTIPLSMLIEAIPLAVPEAAEALGADELNSIRKATDPDGGLNGPEAVKMRAMAWYAASMLLTDADFLLVDETALSIGTSRQEDALMAAGVHAVKTVADLLKRIGCSASEDEIRETFANVRRPIEGNPTYYQPYMAALFDLLQSDSTFLLALRGLSLIHGPDSGNSSKGVG